MMKIVLKLNVIGYMGFIISLFMFRRSLRFLYICCICSPIKTRYTQICVQQFVSFKDDDASSAVLLTLSGLTFMQLLFPNTRGQQ